MYKVEEACALHREKSAPIRILLRLEHLMAAFDITNSIAKGKKGKRNEKKLDRECGPGLRGSFSTNSSSQLKFYLC